MHPFNRPHIRFRQQGQTLVIALIVLGVLLILGLVFLGIINRNILNAARSQRSSESTDLAEAGIRYAHGQLVSSPKGADWRGIPAATLTEITPDVTGDPDAYYLRPPSGLANDLGGPDRLGQFVRVNFPAGRSLVRVRYGASDASPTKLVAGGPLRNLGAARSMLIIESVGRTGVINPSDPTTFNAVGGLKYKNFADDAELNAAIGLLAQANGQLTTGRRMVAYAPIGIIDAARFETNVFNTSDPIELGIADGLGAKAFDDVSYNGGAGTIQPNVDVASSLEAQYGTPGQVRTAGRDAPRGFGSLIANGNVQLFGNVHLYMNQALGDLIRVSGSISGANGKLTISPSTFNGTGYVAGADIVLNETGAGANGSFNSARSNFSTANGLLLDGSARTDVAGFPSGVGTLVPPSTLTIDPQSKLNRYVVLTRESGKAFVNGQQNDGVYGHGGGVYVDNASDRQEGLDATDRRIVGSQRSLFDDWLNPNSGAADSGWKGPFYVPRGATVQLLPDGFIIQRDGSAPVGERTWKNPDGTDSGRTTLRYRLGRVGGQVVIVDSLTAGVADINATTVNFANGLPFNGVLYFEGNVKVRGTIPTEVQMTLVSGATIYIDGAITKGVTENDVTDPSGVNRGKPIGRLPKASLMLMAKDNVAVNTSMFFGPTANQTLESVNDLSGATNVSPVRLRATGGGESGELSLLADLGLDPETSATSATVPSAWKPYALTYKRWDDGGPVGSQFLLGSTMDDGTAAASFLALNVNFGAATGTFPSSAYLFPSVDPDGLIINSAAAYAGLGAGTTSTLYGLGAEPWQRYSRFETRSFPLLANPLTATYDANSGIVGQNAPFNFPLLSGGNDLLFRPGAVAGVSTNDMLVGRVAVTPAEVKIEASIFAEQGSFFVIPGPWFNPDPNDTHLGYAQRIAVLKSGGLNDDQATQRARRERLENYGHSPAVPFYGEPLDVRLTVVGSVAENLPPPISVQSEWVRKWGWIPRRQGASEVPIPLQHAPGASQFEKQAYASSRNFVPNLVIQYDPILATGRLNDSANPDLIRVDEYGRPLPPMPRLPVSPKLAYFGEL